MNAKDFEKYTSAITLSDMEIFVFPELMYSLVLANIMSPTSSIAPTPAPPPAAAKN